MYVLTGITLTHNATLFNVTDTILIYIMETQSPTK